MMRVDKIKIINEMRGDIIVQVGVTAFIEKTVSLQKEIDLKELMEDPWVKAEELIIKIQEKED